MTYNERLAIAAHLHVLIRRITGRVTDVEWMAVNDDYALHIKAYSALKAAETARPDLVAWADKLFIEAKAAAVAPQAPGTGPLGEGAGLPAEAPTLRSRTDKNQKYVGGLRM